jgi:uncharacterized protein (DUF2141 family)
MILKRNLHWLLYPLFVLSCAKQSAPTGGPKDTIPPKLVRAIPPNEALNFKGKSVEMEFSEMIILNNPQEQLIITPSIGKDFQLKTKKNSVILQFENDLLDNTTYTFNFREAVQDVTEKNPVRNFQIAVSTGPYIDSLALTGTVTDLIKGKEIKDATVALHVKNDTFNIMKHPATIFTKTDDKGKFKINHLKPGTYYMYAFEDKNRNLFIDSKTESYSFTPDPINLYRDSSKIALGVIRLDARPLKLTSARPYNTYFNIRTSKNLKTFTLEASNKTDLYYSFGEDQSNIKVYNTITKGDSIQIKLNAQDSIGNSIDTTFYAKFLQQEATPERFSATAQSSSIIADKGFLKVTIGLSKPLKEIDFDSLYFQPDSATHISFTKEDISYDEIHRLLTLNKTLDKTFFVTKEPDKSPTNPAKSNKDKKTRTEKQLNQLYAGRGALISVEQDSSKKLIQSITPLKAEDLSKIIYDIKTQRKKIIIQLLDKDFKVLQEEFDKHKGEFTNLTAGEYLIRVILDQNGNKKWDLGNYYKNQAPETIIYYKEPVKGTMTIKLKANWDYELSPLLISE